MCEKKRAKKDLGMTSSCTKRFSEDEQERTRHRGLGGESKDHFRCHVTELCEKSVVHSQMDCKRSMSLS